MYENITNLKKINCLYLRCILKLKLLDNNLIGREGIETIYKMKTKNNAIFF